MARKLGASIAARYFGIPESTVRHFRDKFDKYAARHDNATSILSSLQGFPGFEALGNLAQSSTASSTSTGTPTIGKEDGGNEMGEPNNEGKAVSSLEILTNLANGNDFSALPSLLGSESGIKREAEKEEKVKGCFWEACLG